MKIAIVSDLTICPGGVHTYLQQIQKYFAKDEKIKVFVFLDSTTKNEVERFYEIQNVHYLKCTP